MISDSFSFGCVRFQTKSQPHQTSASSGQEAKDHVVSPEEVAEVPVETGNRACFSLTLSCQPVTHHQISNADFGVRPSTGYQFQRGISNISTDCCVRFRRLISIISCPCKVCRLCSRGRFSKSVRPRQTKRRQKDAKIPDICFFLPLKKMSIKVLVAISCPFLD